MLRVAKRKSNSGSVTGKLAASLVGLLCMLLFALLILTPAKTASRREKILREHLSAVSVALFHGIDSCGSCGAFRRILMDGWPLSLAASGQGSVSAKGVLRRICCRKILIYLVIQATFK